MNWSIQRVALTTMISKEVGRIFRIWKQTLLPPVITQSLYFIVFGSFIGSQVRNVNGIPYMQFIIPGLVMMAVITAAFTNVSFSFFSAKFMRNVDEVLVAPVHPLTMLAGHIGGGVIRGLLTGATVFGVSLFFVRPEIHSFLILALYTILTSLVFSLGGFLNAVYAKTFDDVGIFSTFALTPLTFLGGVFYPITALPGVWQKISMFNPVVYMIDGFRYSVTGVSEFPLALSSGLLLGLFLVLAVINWYVIRKGAGLKK